MIIKENGVINMNKKDREREKEIKYLMYLKEKLIRETKKEVKQLRLELNQINSRKKKEK